MASLYIKDSDTADRVTRIAQRLGTTKTEAVRRALLALEEQLPNDPADDLVAKLHAWQRAHPLGRATGLAADKAFYDSLYEGDET